MKPILKIGFAAIAKFTAWIVLGLQVQGWEHLPTHGPAILIANHNSHLDTFVLMALYPLTKVTCLRPVANEQYFLRRNPLLAWFARHVLDIIPVDCQSTVQNSGPRRSSHRTFFQRCDEAIARRQILILFPEGSRGQPENLSDFQSGIAHLAKRHSEVPICPIYLEGLGKALPKGDPLLVPFVCRATLSPPLYWSGNKQAFMTQIRDRLGRAGRSAADSRF